MPIGKMNMDEDEQRPAAVKKHKEHQETLRPKIDEWQLFANDGGDLYLDALRRQTHNKPTTPGHPAKWLKRREEVCPEHGLVSASKHIVPRPILLAMMILSLGTWRDDFQYRCPKCGSLTEPPTTE
jgi:hypothetical protein